MRKIGLIPRTTASSLLVAAVALLASPAPACATFIFADVTAISPGTQTAVGQLNGIPFTLVSTRPVLRPISGGAGVIGGVTNGTSTLFNSPFFTPSLALGDNILLGGASDFRLTFASPVTDLTLHIWQLSNNRLSFTSGGLPLAFDLLSSDGDFTVFPGNTSIRGLPPAPGDDANGSLLFRGTYTELSWTAASPVSGNTLEDGYRIQFSVVVAVPEPSSWLLFCAANSAVMFCHNRLRRTRPAEPRRCT